MQNYIGSKTIYIQKMLHLYSPRIPLFVCNLLHGNYCYFRWLHNKLQMAYLQLFVDKATKKVKFFLWSEAKWVPKTAEQS